jgi:hypothetical protein
MNKSFLSLICIFIVILSTLASGIPESPNNTTPRIMHSSSNMMFEPQQPATNNISTSGIIVTGINNYSTNILQAQPEKDITLIYSICNNTGSDIFLMIEPNKIIETEAIYYDGINLVEYPATDIYGPGWERFILLRGYTRNEKPVSYGTSSTEIKHSIHFSHNTNYTNATLILNFNLTFYDTKHAQMIHKTQKKTIHVKMLPESGGESGGGAHKRKTQTQKKNGDIQ